MFIMSITRFAREETISQYILDMITASPEEIDFNTMINKDLKNQFLDDGFIKLDGVIRAGGAGVVFRFL